MFYTHTYTMELYYLLSRAFGGFRFLCGSGDPPRRPTPATQPGGPPWATHPGQPTSPSLLSPFGGCSVLTVSDW